MANEYDQVATTRAMADVLNVRISQREQYTEVHDDAHARNEWADLIDRYACRAVNDDSILLYRRDLAAVAALALAALESSYRTGVLARRLA